MFLGFLFGVLISQGYTSVPSLSQQVLLLSHSFICIANLVYDTGGALAFWKGGDFETELTNK